MKLIFRKTWTTDDDGAPRHNMGAYIRLDCPMKNAHELTEDELNEMGLLADVRPVSNHGPGQWFTPFPFIRVKGRRAVVRQYTALDI